MDISKIKVGSTTYNVKDVTARQYTGTVTGIKVGASGATLSPSSGIVTIPEYSSLGYTEVATGITNLDATLISTALRKTVQTLTAAEQAQVKTNLGIPQTRNIMFSTSEPTSADGSDGDIWLVYEA